MNIVLDLLYLVMEIQQILNLKIIFSKILIHIQLDHMIMLKLKTMYFVMFL